MICGMDSNVYGWRLPIKDPQPGVYWPNDKQWDQYRASLSQGASLNDVGLKTDVASCFLLSDQQWGHIAGEVMHAVGLAPHGDSRAVRWLAVRHAPDHIHLVATLVRQDRRTAWAWQDKLNTQRVCRDLEERYNQYRVAPPGRGSRRWATPAELNKTTRQHRASATRAAAGGNGKRRPVAPREQLRPQVRVVAAAVATESEFFDRLQRSG